MIAKADLDRIFKDNPMMTLMKFEAGKWQIFTGKSMGNDDKFSAASEDEIKSFFFDNQRVRLLNNGWILKLDFGSKWINNIEKELGFK